MFRNTRKVIAAATALAALALVAAHLSSAATAHPGTTRCTLAGKGHAPFERGGAAGQVWRNIGQTCTEDKLQTIYWNQAQTWGAVSIDIVNSGDCDLLVGWAPQEHDLSHGQTWQFRTGKYKGEPIPVGPRGYVQVACINSGDGKCRWRISNLKART